MEPMHTNPSDAVAIHQEVRSKKSIGIHCCTFALTTGTLSRGGSVLVSLEVWQGLEVADAWVISNLLVCGHQAHTCRQVSSIFHTLKYKQTLPAAHTLPALLTLCRAP